MILPDVKRSFTPPHGNPGRNLAVHERARHWWDECLSGSEGVGLAWAALLGFIRF